MGYKFEIPETVQRELDERDAKKEQSLKETTETGVIQFQMPWEKNQRGAPSAIMRSALFGIVKRGRRAYIKEQELVSWGNTNIKYTGENLMQSDQDVWMACVEACKCQGKTDVIISQSELLRLAGKSNTKKWLLSTLIRLVANAITVKDGRYTYIGSLIHNAIKDEETGYIALSINPNMLALFGANVTHIDVEQRAKLGLDLSKWLQGYICSHESTWRKPHFIGLEKLKGLCGSEAIIREFRRAIKKSMDELNQTNVVAGWKLENDIS